MSFDNDIKENSEVFTEMGRKFIDAVKSGDAKNVDKLCRDEWIDKEDNDGLRPIHWACARGHVASVKLLLEKGCQKEAVDKFGWLPIHGACDNGHTDVVQLLLDRCCDVEAETKLNGSRPIHFACSNGHVEVVRLLLHKGAHIEAADEGGCRPIHLACQNGHCAVVKLLLDKECQTETADMVGRRPIHWACTSGNVTIVQFLLDRCCQIEAETKIGRRPIHYACDNEHTTIVQLLLDNGCHIEAEDEKRWRPIHLVCDKGQAEIFQLLVDRGCQMEAETKDGWRPIHLACDKGHANVVQLLLDSGCEIEAADDDGRRPIHLACDKGHGAVVQLLLDRNCQMEAETKDGWRPIHFSCDKGHAAVVQLLLDGGCLIDARTKEGKAPVDLAKEIENKCTKIIQQAKEDRRNTEYSVWHFKDMSVIIRKFKIFSISSVIDAVKESILPIDGPVILFGIDDFVEKFYEIVVGPVLRLVSNEFRYNETVVVDKDDKIKDVLLRLQRCRRWHSVLRYPGTIFKVPQELTVFELLQSHLSADVEFRLETAINWMDSGALHVNYCDSTPFTHGAHYVDALFVCCNDDRTMRQIKEVIIFAFQGNLLYGMKQNTGEANNSKYFLKRLATNKPDLLKFSNCDKMIKGSAAIGDLLQKKIEIKIRQKFAFNSVDFILDTEEIILQEIFDQLRTPFLLKPILPCNPLILSSSSRNLTVDEVKTALNTLLQIEDVIVLHNGQILEGIETLPQQGYSLTDYAAIQSCPKLSEKILIGRGGFANVYKCKEADSDYFALKDIDIPDNSKSPSDVEFDMGIIRELIIAAKVPAHDRIMSYQAFYKENYTFGCHFYITMPLMEGSLSKLLDSEGPLPESDIRHFSNQILLGLNHLHENKVIHRDLKCSNVLIDKDRNVKLCDFGLSKHLNDLASSEATRGLVRSYVGTPNWMAPEMMRDPSVYGINADIWSFGATVVEMITGEAPYFNAPSFELYSKIMEKGVIEYSPPSPLSDQLKSFVDTCLKKKPEDRPSCEELFQHPFLTQ